MEAKPQPLSGVGMVAETSILAELDDAIRSSGSDRRIETLRRVTDLFLTHAECYGPEQIQVFDDVLSRMIRHIEARALSELSSRLAGVDNAPLEVVRQLAMNDAIEVARPVIENSRSLSTGDLVTIASTKSQDHLLAISGRQPIDAAVTDVLVNRGNQEVARRVAVNPGARLSNDGYATLVRRAEDDHELADHVGRRTDIPPKLFQELVAKATETVRERLLASARPELKDGISTALRKASAAVAASSGARDYAAARHLIELMQREGRLKEADVLQFARSRRIEETAVALSVLCATHLDIIDRLLQGARFEALLIPCRAAGMSWETAKAVAGLNPCHAGGPADDTMEQMHRDYTKLSVATAQRILRFWQVRSTAEASSLSAAVQAGAARR
ncbi:MAG: DUF2336 domain-containing protein [Hyphomicrobiales bacterium]|nr:DUF2336 domain-containing protein [Hyphomicrobiales bacterium]